MFMAVIISYVCTPNSFQKATQVSAALTIIIIHDLIAGWIYSEHVQLQWVCIHAAIYMTLYCDPLSSSIIIV